MSKPSKDEWAALKKHLETMFAKSVEIEADGYTIRIVRVRYSAFRDALAIAVQNDSGNWVHPSSQNDAFDKRFLKLHSSYVFPKKARDKFKRASKSNREMMNVKAEWRSNIWLSFDPLRRQLTRECQSIKITYP